MCIWAYCYPAEIGQKSMCVCYANIFMIVCRFRPPIGLITLTLIFRVLQRSFENIRSFSPASGAIIIPALFEEKAGIM